MKVFAVAASMRKDSWNKKLICQVVEILKTTEVEIDHADFKDFDMPLMDEDLEAESGIPEGAKKLIKKIEDADVLIVSTPEYNGTIPGPLKNAIDWVSRKDPVPLRGKPMLLLAASPGQLGGVRALWHTRVPFEVLGTQVFADMIGVPKAHEAFDEHGKFIDPKLKDRIETLVKKFLEWNR